MVVRIKENAHQYQQIFKRDLGGYLLDENLWRYFSSSIRTARFLGASPGTINWRCPYFLFPCLWSLVWSVMDILGSRHDSGRLGNMNGVIIFSFNGGSFKQIKLIKMVYIVTILNSKNILVSSLIMKDISCFCNPQRPSYPNLAPPEVHLSQKRVKNATRDPPYMC